MRQSDPQRNSLLLGCALALIWVLAGCSLAGDLTPPPQLATAQAAQAQVQTSPTSVPVSVSPPSSPPDLANGQAIFAENCVPCHGETGMGDGPMAANLPQGIQPAALGDPVVARAATPNEWYRIVTQGNIDNFMPGFSSLTDAQRWDVVAYSFSLSQSGVDFQAAEALYLDECATCHGVDGEGTDSAGVLSDLSVISSTSTQGLFELITEGNAQGMPAFGEQLTEDQRRTLAAYLQHQAFVGTGTSTAEGETSEQPAAEEPVIGAIRGQVINQTNSGDVPSGMQVTLHGFDGQDEVVTTDGQINSAGEFEFLDLESVSGRVFVVTAEYKGVLYGTEAAHLSSSEDVFLPLDIYETTPDTSNLQVDRLHVIFDVPFEGTLEVTELWIISNSGTETVADAQGNGIFQIHIPTDATNLQFEGGALGDRFLRNEFGFIDLSAVRPGTSSHEIVVSFDLAYDGTRDFAQAMEYPVVAAIILLPEDGPQVSGDTIQDLGVQNLGGINFQTYSAEPLSPGATLDVTVRGGAAGGASDTQGLLIGIASLAVALAAVGYWWLRRRTPVIRPETAGVSGDEKDDLLQELAELDDEFERGDLPEREYQRQRSQLKSELRALLREERRD